MKRAVRFLFALVGVAIGLGLIKFVQSVGVLDDLRGLWNLSLYIAGGIVMGVVLYMTAPKFIHFFAAAIETVSNRFETVPLSDVVIGTLGLLIGLILAGLISSPVLQLSISYVGNIIGVILAVIIYVALGLLGIRVALKNRDEILSIIRSIRDGGREKEKKKEKHHNEKNRVPKILDTSVVIDGRIFAIIALGFLEGPFIISQFVLEELQHIADSSDPLKRERGRSGLDRIQEFQKSRKVEILVDNQPIPHAEEVDAKLLALTRNYGGKIITNDYNLNKVATVQNIPVLNVNDLANALKPVVIPGERISVDIIKEGKEKEQGIGYLDDGTMIVVENGGKAIGKTKTTVVTSVLQTSAGKMIFSRIEQ